MPLQRYSIDGIVRSTAYGITDSHVVDEDSRPVAWKPGGLEARPLNSNSAAKACLGEQQVAVAVAGRHHHTHPMAMLVGSGMLPQVWEQPLLPGSQTKPT